MKLLKKLMWLLKRYRGKKYFITYVEEGLLEDEILVKGHRIYILHKKSQNNDV